MALSDKQSLLTKCTVLIIIFVISQLLYSEKFFGKSEEKPYPLSTRAAQNGNSVLFSSSSTVTGSSRWVVIISSSFEWHSYRHTSDALSFFCLAQSFGIDKRHIILMLSHPLLACDSRNPHPARIVSSNAQNLCSKKKDLFSETGSRSSQSTSSNFKERDNLWTKEALSHIDYCGATVNVNTVLSLLQGGNSVDIHEVRREWSTGWNPPALWSTSKTPHVIEMDQKSDILWGKGSYASAFVVERRNPFESYFKMLQSDAHSDVVVYLVGHGYSSHFKFNEFEFLSARQLARAVDKMYQKGRFRRLLILLDTCQAISMCKAMYTPNVVCIGAASAEDYSYASSVDFRLMSHLASSSDWMGELVKALEKSNCYHTSSTVSSLPTPSLSRASGRHDRINTASTRNRNTNYLFEPLTSLGARLLPHQQLPLKAQRSFGAVNGLFQWSLGDFLCPAKETTSEKVNPSSSSKVESIPSVSMDSFLSL